MKILHIFSNEHKGNGVIEVLKSLFSELIKHENIDIGVYTNSLYSKEMEKLLNELGVTYYYNKKPYIINDFKESVPDWEKYELAHIHGVFFLKNMLLARKIFKLGLRYIITPHGNLMEKALKTKSKRKKYIFRKLLSDKVLDNAAGIHALANEEKESILKVTNNTNVFIIPNGINKTPSNRNSISKNKDQYNILFVGRLDVIHKGLDLLVETIDENTDYYKSKNIKIHLVGYYSSKADEEYFKRALKKSPELTDIFIFHGARYGEEKNTFFETADIFIHTSRYEGMPIAVLEALYYELPCIVTAGSNMTDIISKSESGECIKFNKNQLHSALSRLISKNKDELREMGRKGNEYISKELSWDLIANSYLVQYGKLINQGRNSEEYKWKK